MGEFVVVVVVVVVAVLVGVGGLRRRRSVLTTTTTTTTTTSTTNVEKGLGKRIVLDLERGDVLVLVGGDGYELRLVVAGLGDPLAPIRLELVDDEARLVLVQRVELYLALVGRLVGELHLAERHGLLHPVSAEVGRVGMLVLALELRRVGLGALLPLAVDVLPLVVVDLVEVDDELVDGARLQAAHAHLEHREHVATRARHDHLVRLAEEAHPQVAVLEANRDAATAAASICANHSVVAVVGVVDVLSLFEGVDSLYRYVAGCISSLSICVWMENREKEK